MIGNGLGFTIFWPIDSKSDSYESLWHFVKDIGIMEQLVTDGDPTMAYKAWKDMIREYRIKQTTTEPYSPWQNCAELDVRVVKRSFWRFTKKTKSPKRLWCFLGIHICALRGFTAYDSVNLMGHCAAEFVLCYAPDISAYVQHEWYETIWYQDQDGESKIG